MQALCWFILGMMFLPTIRDWWPKRPENEKWKRIIEGSAA